jgi:hypothetical protein
MKKKKVYYESELIGVLEQRCLEAGSTAAWCREVGLSPQYVSDLKRGRAPFSNRAAIALGLRRVIVFVDPKADASKEMEKC